MPTISIIVPVYKVEDWIRRCLDSILAQTYTDFECILVDDGSPDNCGKICDEYAGKDARFVVIHQKNSGVAAARNAALQVAKGRWLAFCDPDDCMAHGLLQTAVQLQAENPDAMVVWEYSESWDEFCARQAEQPCFTRYRFSSVVWRDMTFDTLWLRLYDADFIRAQGLCFDASLGWKDLWGEDTDFNKRYFAARYPAGDFDVLLTEQPLYFYFRGNPKSITQGGDNAKAQYVEYPPQKNHCAALLAQYPGGVIPAQLPQGRQAEFIRHHLRGLAYGVYSAKKLGEALPAGFFASEAVQDLLARCKQNKIFNVYYLPFKLRQKRFVARLYRWDEVKHINYYRTREILKRLFFGSWSNG